MTPPGKPPNEAARLAMLRALHLLDTPAEPVFDALTRLATKLLHTPVALISLVDESRQWFKSNVGLSATETPRDVAFCAHAIHGGEPLVVEDACQDARFQHNPLVTGQNPVRAYAGVPLTTSEGLALGTLCVIDHRVRVFSADDLETLKDLAMLARNEILRREAAWRAQVLAAEEDADRAESNALFRVIFEQAAVGIALVGLDGHWLEFNSTLCRILGRPPESLHGATFQDITHPDDLSLDLQHVHELLEGKADQYAMEKRYLRPDGEVVWANLTVALVRRHGVARYFISVIDDISDRKRADKAMEQLRADLERRVVERTRDLQRSNDLIKAVLHNARNAFICIDEQGLVLDWNPEAEAIFGWQRNEVMGLELAQLIIPPHLQDAHRRGMQHMLQTGDAPLMGQRLELPAVHRLGHHIPCEVTINALPSLPGDPRRRYFAFLHDITSRKQAARALEDSERRLHTIADNLPALIAYVDTQERYLFCNQTFDTWLGVGKQQAIGRTVQEVLGDAPYGLRKASLQQALRGEPAETDVDVGEGTSLRHLHLVYLPDRGPDGQVVGFFVFGTDVTDARLAQRNLLALASTDSLTGLPNRRAFEDMLDKAIARQHRSGRPLALAFLDLDRFKSINDTHGHGIGDEVLQTFALRLTASVRASDTVARLAGDEFVILLEGMSRVSEVDVVAAKILNAISSPFELSGDLILHVSTSIGVAYQAGPIQGAPALIETADQALYEAKAAGRNTHRVTVIDAPRV
ncbi:PAS domain S-box protein [Aquabacterium sp.]|uniref:PAS domain S-box protein n=1 Tax=Aquabacterium sp. TaxID=1872578 RepID=UPI0019BC403B|nr:PAS domain S-box protein [Aquabacterium sp.]MBC7699414.1 PAS domain S-box protein [Aquabacterium sp.]